VAVDKRGQLLFKSQRTFIDKVKCPQFTLADSFNIVCLSGLSCILEITDRVLDLFNTDPPTPSCSLTRNPSEKTARIDAPSRDERLRAHIDAQNIHVAATQQRADLGHGRHERCRTVRSTEF
jgi:hypothetical protein